MNKDCKRIVKIGGGLLVALVIFVYVRKRMRENYDVRTELRKAK